MCNPHGAFLQHAASFLFCEGMERPEGDAADQAFLAAHEQDGGLWLPEASSYMAFLKDKPGCTMTIAVHKPTISTSCGILLRSYRTESDDGAEASTSSTRIAGLSNEATKAGFKLGMRVIQVNGREVTGASMACDIMKETVGKVELTVIADMPTKFAASCWRNTAFLWVMWSLIVCNYCALMISPNMSFGHLLVGHLLLGLHSYSLYLTLTTHPGLVPENWLAEKAFNADEHSAHGGVVPPDVPHFVCPRSKRRLPPRAFFVGLTGESFLFLDHYCNLLATPIGLRNRRHFLIFLLYAALLSIFGVTATGATAYSAASHQDPIFALVSFVLAVLDLIAASWLGYFSTINWRIAGRNATTIGDAFGRDETEYDLGDTMQNLEVSIFGPRPAWMWALPRRNGGPLADGFTWKTSQCDEANLKAL